MKKSLKKKKKATSDHLVINPRVRILAAYLMAWLVMPCPSILPSGDPLPSVGKVVILCHLEGSNLGAHSEVEVCGALNRLSNHTDFILFFGIKDGQC